MGYSSLNLPENLASSSRTQRLKRDLLAKAIAQPLDRVNVLGDDISGHTGCVNAVDWARDGELLLTGGDDTTVRIWRADNTDSEQPAPYRCTVVLHTGHTQNIFSTKMLPMSTKIVSVAGDDQVRIFDIEGGVSIQPGPSETEYTARGGRVLRCHDGRVKRIITEGSPDLFLTVSEDHTVRQHDLRVPHSCRRRHACGAPLLEMPFELSAISISPLTPHQLVVAGESPVGYLFDRRHVGRYLKQEWGVPPREEDITTCVRRFARGPGRRQIGRAHVTGARASLSNGHEVLLSYSGDDVYLFSTRDEPAHEPHRVRPVIAPNSRKRRVVREDTMEEDEEREASSDEEESELGTDGEEDQEVLDSHSGVPRILPRLHFHGACNNKTVKDGESLMNFLGPDDEFVASGSDDGNVFIWKKSTGQLVDILEGDDQIVNVIEGHPHLPIVAVSGIDTTVKLFAPARPDKPRVFSRMEDAADIIRRNEAEARRNVGMFGHMDEEDLQELLDFVRQTRQGGTGAGATTRPECTHQ